MLPRPSTAASAPVRHRWSSFRLRQHLLSRSRVTNLALWLLVASLLLSVAINFRQWKPSILRSDDALFRVSSLQRDAFGDARASHLVVVAGHAIWKGCQGKDWNDEKDWVLHDYQTDTNSVQTYYAHIVKGVELLASDPSAVLFFSGGITRPNHPFQSEAQSYLSLAFSTGLLPSPLLHRVFTEDYALDSYQNLLFSLARYHEVASSTPTPEPFRWPSKLTMVGFEMKRRRFVELHRRAIRWPLERFQYVGVDLPDETAMRLASEGEMLHGYLPYKRDLYGCHDKLLEKRVTRNPFARFHPYHSTNPELAKLLDWCPAISGDESDPQRHLFHGDLPWHEY